jgi:hypothetical protein
MTYDASDDDLPVGFFEKANQLTQAHDRIRAIATDMGITIEAEQLKTFAILLVALEQTEAPRNS